MQLAMFDTPPADPRLEVGVELEVDERAGEGALAERGADLAPHPTRGKLMPPEVFTERCGRSSPRARPAG